MDHAKKMILVDPQTYIPTPSMQTDRKLSELDYEMQTTLNSDIPDDQKAKLYVATLKKFRAFENNARAPEIKNVAANELKEALSPAQQYKAKKLLRLIKDNPALDWSDKGELIYKQTLVPNSHIADLFEDALATKRPVDGPIAWEEFGDVLDSSNVPHTLAKRRVKRRVKKLKTAWIKTD